MPSSWFGSTWMTSAFFQANQFYCWKSLAHVTQVAYIALQQLYHDQKKFVKGKTTNIAQVAQNMLQLNLKGGQCMQSKEYYTAQEAQEILNMTYSALRNQVIAG